MTTDQQFRFVSPAIQLTTEIEQQICLAKAWVSITSTGEKKPTFGELGAVVVDSYIELRNELNQMKDSFNKQLNEEKHNREEADLIIANHIAKIENLLKEKAIIESQKERIEDAHSILYYCQICFDNPRQIRFTPCGHTICCNNCAQVVITGSIAQRKCPVCRVALTGIQQVFL